METLYWRGWIGKVILENWKASIGEVALEELDRDVVLERLHWSGCFKDTVLGRLYGRGCFREVVLEILYRRASIGDIPQRLMQYHYV